MGEEHKASVGRKEIAVLAPGLGDCVGRSQAEWSGAPRDSMVQSVGYGGPGSPSFCADGSLLHPPHTEPTEGGHRAISNNAKGSSC